MSLSHILATTTTITTATIFRNYAIYIVIGLYSIKRKRESFFSLITIIIFIKSSIQERKIIMISINTSQIGLMF